MVYVQLKTPINGYDRLRVFEYHVFDIFNSNHNQAIGFRYHVYAQKDNGLFVLYEKYHTITDTQSVAKIMDATGEGFNNYDALSKSLLDYLVAEGLAQGTIEKE
jgi:hypothetical protein